LKENIEETLDHIRETLHHIHAQFDDIERTLRRIDDRLFEMLWTFRLFAVTAAALLCGILLRI